MGLGADFDETLMSQIAQKSGGRYHFVDDASRVARVFDSELSKMQRVVAQNAWVELSPGPGVVIQDVVGVEHSTMSGGRNVRFSLGEVSEGQRRDVSPHGSISIGRSYMPSP